MQYQGQFSTSNISYMGKYGQGPLYPSDDPNYFNVVLLTYLLT